MPPTCVSEWLARTLPAASRTQLEDSDRLGWVGGCLGNCLAADVVIVSVVVRSYSGAVHSRGRATRHSWLAWGVVGVWCLAASAKPAAAVAANEGVSEFVSRAWQVEDGLPQNSVTSLVQGKDGYLWLGTANGLARFDGIRFRSFGLADGLPSLLVHALLEDREGALWIGTASGLSRYLDGRFTSWTKQNGLAGEVIMALAEARDGAIWIGTTAGLSRWRQGAFETMELKPGLAHGYVRALAADRDGAVWASIAELGLLRWDGQRFAGLDKLHSPPSVPPYQIMEDRAGRLWAGTVGGIFCRQGDTWKGYGTAEGLPRARITGLAEGADGTIWAGSLDEGLYYLTQGKFHRVTQTDGLSDDAVSAIMEDHEKNVWVGTRAGGLNRLKPRQLSMWTIRDGATEAAPISLAESAEGVLWVCSPGRGFYRLDRQKEGRFVREELAEQPPFGALLITRDGSLWWGTASVLYHWKDGQRVAVYRDEAWLRGDAVRCLCEDREDGLWIGTRNGKLILLRRGQFSAFTNGLPQAALTSLAQQRDGTLWIGSYGGGLGRLKDGHGTVFGRRQGLGSDLIRALFVDSTDTLWIGTEGGGLGCFKSGALHRFTAQQGVGDDTIVQILEDNARQLWLGTFHGIFQVPRRELDELVAGHGSQVHPRIFGRSDGMRSEQCAVGFGTCLKTRDGLLCFSTDRGIAVIDAQALQDVSRPPRVRLDVTLVDGKALPIPAGRASLEAGSDDLPAMLTVPAGKQRLEFRFAGLYFSAPERVCYRYQLEGLDAGWVEAGTARTADYSFVPPGNYRFRVTAHNGNGVWNAAGAVLDLKVLPHFWQTWWFRVAGWLGGVATASGTLAAVLRRRQKLRMQALERQRAIERERSRIAQDMHDELGSRLTKAGMVTEMIRREPGESPARPQRIETLRDTLQEMTVTMDELVWAVNPRHDTLDGLANYVVRFTQEFFADTGIECVLNVPADLPAVPLTAQIRHNLFLAFKEALNNAAKHATATQVTVHVEFAAGRLLVEVADNGTGFANPPPQSGRRGLANMRDRLDAIGGSCEVESKPGAGTRVLLKTPLTG